MVKRTYVRGGGTLRRAAVTALRMPMMPLGTLAPCCFRPCTHGLKRGTEVSTALGREKMTYTMVAFQTCATLAQDLELSFSLNLWIYGIV